MKIRQFHANDTDTLVAIWRAASDLAHPFLPGAFLAQEAENLKTLHFPQAETWVLEDKGKALGFIALLGNEIGGLFVDPSRHGKGLGRRLVDHAMARKGRLSVDVFENNAIGIRFYYQYGFVQTHCYRHTESGEMMLRLELRGAD